MPFYELFDETLDINSTENYELSVQLSTDSLSFCILDGIRNKYILFRSFTPDNYRHFTPGQITELIGKDDFLTKNYRKVNTILPSPRFTMVPAPLFDPGKKEEYFTFNHVISESSQILINRISDPDSYLLFAVSGPVLEIANGFDKGADPMHHMRPLFHQINQVMKVNAGYYIHAHIEADFFNLIIFNEKVLKFCNSFVYRNTSDILYHIFNVFKNLNIGQEETITLSGNAEMYDDLYSGLAMYIRGVKFAEPAGTFTFSYVFNDTPLHKYINLFTAISCGS
jgi:Protein of unknown function (DUF3822)